jgi:hypothetical protein
LTLLVSRADKTYPKDQYGLAGVRRFSATGIAISLLDRSRKNTACLVQVFGNKKHNFIAVFLRQNAKERLSRLLGSSEND